ncbi:hypothetical protein J4438_03855 [Candidatus Woesearchaeota archaeon]|nr:hypothetical protein [Candidatus Woesearchaeota archaeon]
MTLDIQLDNLGTVNKNLVTMTINSNKLELWFSYRTIVAFSKNGKTHCIKNQWGPTTGKLLNDICPNKSDRLSEIKFAEELNKLLII